MNDNSPRRKAAARSTHPWLHWITMSMLALMMSLSEPAAHAADGAEFTKRIELVCIGHTEAQVLQLLDRQPDRTQRTNALGLQKSVLEFDVGAAQYTLTFYAGRLVATTIRSRKPSLLDKLNS